MCTLVLRRSRTSPQWTRKSSSAPQTSRPSKKNISKPRRRIKWCCRRPPKKRKSLQICWTDATSATRELTAGCAVVVLTLIFTLCFSEFVDASMKDSGMPPRSKPEGWLSRHLSSESVCYYFTFGLFDKFSYILSQQLVKTRSSLS